MCIFRDTVAQMYLLLATGIRTQVIVYVINYIESEKNKNDTCWIVSEYAAAATTFLNVFLSVICNRSYCAVLHTNRKLILRKISWI
jgi:DNA-binding transcriptional regulator PaaX